MTAATIILAVIFAAGGAVAFTAGITGSRWFFSSAGSRAFTGRRMAAARILYTLAGAAMIAVAAAILRTVI